MVCALLKFVLTVFRGNSWCMIVGKYLSEVANEFVVNGFVGGRLLFKFLGSTAIAKPTILTITAMFMSQGMVFNCTCLFGMFSHMNNPPSMLPNATCFIGLVSDGLFYLMIII